MKKLEKFKKFLEEKVILSAVMCILLALVLITATYAWYTLNNTPKMYGLELSTSGAGGLIVAIEPGGPDIMSGEYYSQYYNRFGAATQFNDTDGSLTAMIPINLGSFKNIQSDMIAPGAYGPLPFYITSQSPNIRSYEIKIQFEYEPSENATAGMTDDQKETMKKRVENMIMDHFTVYKTRYETVPEDPEEDSIVLFKDPLIFYPDESDEQDSVISTKGNLEFNKEEPVELWWVWNYEITDIPEYWNIARFTDDKEDGGFGFELSVDENGKAINEIDTREAVRKYDEEDTELGNYLDDIWFNVYVVGNPGTVE